MRKARRGAERHSQGYSPISAALLANSDLRGCCASPLAADFSESDRRERLWAPTLEATCRFCTCVRTERNSEVRSCIDVTAIVASFGCGSDGGGGVCVR